MTAMEALELDPLLTTEQVARRYNYHPQSLRNLLAKGKGPKAIKLPGGRIRYRASDLLAWEISAYDVPDEVAS
ncbi:DNA-binding protein [Mesorhizobium sp. M1A.F.Ca.IN.020.06.1.1]|uniref:helix-turn-helix transcriptional regulator n=1 Tax=unclassified Mesorhizobium TaxID=325217 RepID=UPI000FC9EC1B|nr:MULTISPECIES: helix-turn-helix domain-containing protein [unclassified Mesorhizobium]RUV05563.1 DNA-binding protein [Mesorhizobium sp. M1A.F.Ca.IN.020.03.2.1]RUV87697.1 DNA-binding protein [Mesorhizobium sp. M1A.F.Ca.IN.020.32.1.1]RUW05874.1 DNA-binding protein [Mesorhizobium sp. M1A.F.Ca.IN.022.05.2.1]RUW23182.1 DNA-binding protein [Mesorhizobium sp. M1A.F.Ca.IN.020.06.1.1]RWF80862.1 MAG: DNA-binding protein [Mesorhizobium sp.]